MSARAIMTFVISLEMSRNMIKLSAFLAVIYQFRWFKNFIH